MWWKNRPITPQPWHAASGCIYADRNPDGSFPDMDDIGYYGGALVCESMSEADAKFAVLAIRQRDLLWTALMRLGKIDSMRIQDAVRATITACREAEEDVESEGLAHEHILKVLRLIMPDRYDAKLLPEFASRARIEPERGDHWPWWPMQFVTDNIELAWVQSSHEAYFSSPLQLQIMADEPWPF